jgi:hypothetical protein
MRYVATLLIMIGMLGAAPQGFTQERESRADEQWERQARVQRDVPADLQRGRQALESAQRELAAAGDQWGRSQGSYSPHIMSLRPCSFAM